MLKSKVNKITVMLGRVLMTFKKPSFIFPPFKCISFNSKTSREIPMWTHFKVMTKDYQYFTIFHILFSSPMASLIPLLKGL